MPLLIMLGDGTRVFDLEQLIQLFDFQTKGLQLRSISSAIAIQPRMKRSGYIVKLMSPVYCEDATLAGFKRSEMKMLQDWGGWQ